MEGDIFDTLKNEFNIEEEKAEAVSESPKYIEKVEEKLKNQKYNIDDIEYMKTELMSLIATNQTVLAGLADQLKIGCPPHMYDVFRNLTETISNQIMKLFQLHKQMTDYQVVETNENLRKEALEQRERIAQMRQSKPGTMNTQINAYTMDSNQTLDLIQNMINKAKENSLQLKDEQPEFDLS